MFQRLISNIYTLSLKSVSRCCLCLFRYHWLSLSHFHSLCFPRARLFRHFITGFCCFFFILSLYGAIERSRKCAHARTLLGSVALPYELPFFSCCFSFHVYEIENTYTSYYNIGQKGARVSLSSSFFLCVCLWEKLQARAKTQSKYLLYWSECVYRKVNYTYVATSYRIAIKCTLFRFNFDRKNCAPTREFRREREKKIFTERKENNKKKVFWNAETRINIDFIFISWLNLLRAQSLSSTSKTAMAWPIWLLFYRLTIRFFNYYQKSKFNLYAYQHENP